MPTITLDFPDDETWQRFQRWWDLIGKESCRIFMQQTLVRTFVHIDDRNDPETWVFTWDTIPF